MDESSEPVRVSGLIDRVPVGGTSSSGAWRSAVEICSDLEVQRGWADWEHVSDQIEIGLRLQVLSEVEAAAEELEELLSFYFRASAPELYRPAALALGRHSRSNSSFEQTLGAYARRHGLELDAPIRLGGERSRRRMLLANTGRWVAGGKAGDSEVFPVDVTEGGGDPDRPTADVAALCVACDALLEGGSRRSDFVEFCWELAATLEGHLGRGGSQRSLVRVWGSLLRRLEALDAERAAEVWREVVGSLERRSDATYPERLATLWEFDALVALAAESGSQLARSDRLDEIEDPELQWLARVRFWQWRRRRDSGAGAAVANSASVPAAVASPLRDFIGDVVRPVQEGESQQRALHRWVAASIARLADPAKWWSEPYDNRALVSFLLLDTVRHRATPRDSVVRLLEAAGVVPEREPRESDVHQGLPGAPWSGFHDILWFVFRREGMPADFPVESESFTNVATPDRLLQFVPADHTVRDLEILVDALEHFIRLELATEPEFDLRFFLFRIAVRKPAPNLFRQLASRTRDRTYRDTDDCEVDVWRAIERVALEAERSREAGGETFGSGGDSSESTSTETVESLGDDWFPELGESRRALAEVVDEPDLHEALEEFADRIDPRIPNPPSRNRGLIDLIGRSVEDGDGVLLRSEGGSAAVSIETLSTGVIDDVRRLREGVVDLFETGGVEIADMHRAARALVRRLETIRDRLSPHVPGRDAQLLEEIVAELCNRLIAWTRLLERGIEAPLAAVSVDDEEGERRLFERVAESTEAVEESSMRIRAFEIAYDLAERRLLSAPDRIEPGAGGELDAADWLAERRLLAAAAEVSEELDLGEAWSDFLAGRWERLVEFAMEAQAEGRVVELAVDESVAGPRRCARDSMVMERLEQWLMDRYHVRSVARLLGQRRGNARGSPAPLGWAVARLGQNFTHVWLALLVGAVMILDFGDAWVELARQGDVPGIATTFVLGLGGTFLYLLFDLDRKTQTSFEDDAGFGAVSRLTRVLGFLAICSVYTVAVTSGLWYLFSGTDMVLHGPAAALHILVWTGFALFVGVFFGLLTDSS